MNAKIKNLAMVCACALILGAIVPVVASGQSQQSSQESVAEAARRAREKKQAAAKPAKVITNDDLKPAAPETSSPETAAQPAAGSPQQAGQEQQGAGPAAKATSEGKESKEAKAKELEDLKKQLAAAQSDLDLLQRELALQRDTYYANPDYAHDTDGKAKLDALQIQITDKQQAVEELKTKVAALQELVGPSANGEKPAAPSQP
jgi:uncharacterized coiled-coil protein SlyX